MPIVETTVAEQSSKDVVHVVTLPSHWYVSSESFMRHVKLVAIKHFIWDKPLDNYQATLSIAFDSGYMWYFPTAVSFDIAFNHGYIQYFDIQYCIQQRAI